MKPNQVEELYERYYSGGRARQGVFDAIAAWKLPTRALYPGGFIHVTASFVFPSVVYVDNNRNAARFFKQPQHVDEFVSRHKRYPQDPEIGFYPQSYESPLAEGDECFDLLISLFAGFISEPCKRYLAVGGILAANNSHADAGLASIDPDYRLIGVVRETDGSLRVDETELDTYFQPKKPVEVTKALLRERGRGLDYSRTAEAYLFRRVS